MRDVNSPEATKKLAETLLADLEEYNASPVRYCSECPFRLKEPEEDPHYGRHICGWLFLKSAITKFLRK